MRGVSASASGHLIIIELNFEVPFYFMYVCWIDKLEKKTLFSVGLQIIYVCIYVCWCVSIAYVAKLVKIDLCKSACEQLRHASGHLTAFYC